MNPLRDTIRLSSEIPESDDIQLIDIIPLEHLQSLQDKFSTANGVASVILDLTDKPVTRPSNFNEGCTSAFYPGKECLMTGKLIGGTDGTGHSCKLSVAKSPILIDGKHVANWKIGMCGFGRVIAPLMRATCADDEKFEEIHTQLSDKLKAHFQSVYDLLQITAGEISEIGYSNIRLARELLKQEENEARLAEREITFRSIFENSVDGISLVGKNGIVREWSLGYEKLTGIPKEQAVGNEIWGVIASILSREWYSEDEINQLRNRLEMIIAREEQATISRHIVNRKTQQALIINTLYFPVYLPEGVLLGAISRDITENVIKERELLAEKERLQALGDNYPDGCLYRASMDSKTKELKFNYLSKPWETFSGGIPIETVLNDTHVVFSHILPEDLPMLQEAIVKSAETMTNLMIEIRFRLDDQAVKWAQVSSAPHTEGHLVVWDGYILDITERKNNELKLDAYRSDLEHAVAMQTEALQATNEELYAANEELYATNEEFAVTNEELHKKNVQLQEEIAARLEVMRKLEYSENTMRNFIAQTFEGIVIVNHEGRVIEWNPEQERISEIPREEAIGQYCWDIYQYLLPDQEDTAAVEQFREHILSLLDPGNRQQLIDKTEYILLIPGKGERYISITTFRIALPDKCYVGEIVQDTTESKLLDMELERYRTQLEEMVASQTRELIESKARLTSLSDNLPGGVIFQMFVKEGQALQFTYISARFAEMFQLSVDDAMEDCSLFFKMFHPDDQEKVLNLFGASQAGFADAECRICLDTGDTKWMHLRSSYHIQDDHSFVWDGFMVDITDSKYAEQELEETRRRQNLLIKVLQIVQASDKLSAALSAALSEIGKFAGVSRSYIFEKSADGTYAANTYEWCNEGIAPEIDNLQEVPIDFMSDWFDAFENNEYICVSDIADLSPAACEKLAQQGIKSILVLPLETKGNIYGFVGFDECINYKQWNRQEVELLISLSQIISTTTRRFRAEESIRLSQQTLHTILDNISSNIIVTEFETCKLLFANKAVKKYVGEDIEGKQCWRILQKDLTGPCDFCPHSRLLDSENKQTGQYRWEYQNHKMNKWLECTDSAIEWVDGRMVHMEYATDITDRRVAEEALRRSEEMYRQLTVASPDAIVVCNPQGKVVFMSHRAKELFLISSDTDFGKIRINRYVHPHDLKNSIRLFLSLVEGNVSFLPQLLLMREDGSDFFGEISAASVKNEQGKTASVIMVIRDITERKMNEMELIRAKEKAEESDKLKSAFLANMSHEIRTPINGIIGFLNFLADDNLSPRRRHDYITVVNNSSVQLVKLIDDIIDVAKIEAKQMSLHPTLFHLNDFMRELQVFFETYLQANNKERIALILDDSQFIDPDVTFVDPMRLRQVLTNLIGNAVKFTEKGFIGFGYRPLPPNQLEFWVEDSGIGLAPDQLEVIFERFRQAELTNSRKYGGTGLGLTISRSLAQLMGGDIDVESTQSEGSTFKFTISYLPVTPEDEPLFAEKADETALGGQPFEGMAILLVIPDLMTFKYYEKLLAPTGATLIHAQTAKQWIDTISQWKHINVALADARIFQNEDNETLYRARTVRAGLPLVLVVPENNESYSRVISDMQCNKVIGSMTGYAALFQVLKNYM